MRLIFLIPAILICLLKTREITVLLVLGVFNRKKVDGGYQRLTTKAFVL